MSENTTKWPFQVLMEKEGVTEDQLPDALKAKITKFNQAEDDETKEALDAKIFMEIDDIVIDRKAEEKRIASEKKRAEIKNQAQSSGGNAEGEKEQKNESSSAAGKNSSVLGRILRGDKK